MRKRLILLTLASTLASTVGVVLHSRAVTTQTFDLDSPESFAEGELDRTSVSSLGEVTVGRDVRRLALEGIALVWCALQKGEEVFLGTGNDGKVLVLRGEETSVYAETGELIVSALAVGEGGDLYAGTVPGGKILRIKGRGRVETFATLPEVEHVWALEYDTERHVLFAGTGPSGQVFAIDRTGRPEVYYDTEETHVLSLARGEAGEIYAGTSPGSILLRIDAPGRGRAVHDFEATEVKAIARRGSDVFVAVNEFPTPPSPPAKGTKISTEPDAASKAPGATTKGSKRQGKGSLFRVGSDGRVDRLVKNDGGHLTDVEAQDGRVYASVGEDGRILAVDDDRTVRTLIDVEERQVLALALGGRTKVFATGDAGAVYRVLDSRPQDATYTTKVLDAGFLSRFGSLSWRGRGPLVVQTRSGNTAKPDSSWSDWSAALETGARVPSPAARYVQVRVKFDPAADSVLHALRVHYLNQNQRALLTEVEVKGKNAPSKEDAAEAPEHSTILKVSWKVDNPDSDPMRYRVSFRREGDDAWRPVGRPEEILTKTDAEWNTESVAPGWYVLRVEASDERGNPASQVERHEKRSRPVLVDNAPPRISDVAVAGRSLRGQVEDADSNVVRIEYAIDGGEWRLIFPSDDLYDARIERFEVTLGDEAPAGARLVAVRAFDEGGNQAAAQTTARLPALAAPAPPPAKRPPR